jgi:hypothetical protein
LNLYSGGCGFDEVLASKRHATEAEISISSTDAAIRAQHAASFIQKHLNRPRIQVIFLELIRTYTAMRSLQHGKELPSSRQSSSV